MARLFGTDGVRGIFEEKLTCDLAYRLGRAGALVLGEGADSAPVFITGRDTRQSGAALEEALSRGIRDAGGIVITLGVIPTPAVACLVTEYKADAGVVISASHNTYEYNGIKFFNGNGYKLSDELEDRIEEKLDVEIEKPGGFIKDDVQGGRKTYVEHLLSCIDINLKGLKVVLDCANGASYETAPKVYESLGADVTIIGNTPDGVNINDGYGSTHPENLCRKVVEENADLGLAFDGDADRLIAVDEKGNIVDGDRTICICAKMLKDEGRMKEKIVTGTVMSNLGFHKYLNGIGLETVSTKVGDRYVLESMLETGSVIGGEQSGHIIFKDYATTGDGTLASLQLVKAMRVSGRKLSELADEIPIYPQVLVNAKVKEENKEKFKTDEEVLKAIEALEEKMAGEGRVLIRPSGTEPLVRVMIEGNNTDEITGYAHEMADLLERKFS